MNDDDLKALVDAFLVWPLPDDVKADAVACKPGAQPRTGTNLLTATQARAMFTHCLAVVRAHDGDATRCPGCDHQRLEAGGLRRELAAARAELQKVRSAAISGMDAATQHGRTLVQQAARLKAESNPDALESERAANALLTEQLQKAEAEVERLRAVLFVARHALEYAGGNWIGAMSSRPIWDALSAIDAA